MDARRPGAVQNQLPKQKSTKRHPTLIRLHRGEGDSIGLQETLEQERVPLQVVLQAVVDFICTFFQILPRRAQRLFPVTEGG